MPLKNIVLVVTKMSCCPNVPLPKCPITKMACYRNICDQNIHYRSVLSQNVWIPSLQCAFPRKIVTPDIGIGNTKLLSGVAVDPTVLFIALAGPTERIA